MAVYSTNNSLKSLTKAKQNRWFILGAQPLQERHKTIMNKKR